MQYEKDNYFIFAGRLDELKGIPFLFETWLRYAQRQAEQRPATLLVCGDGPLRDWCQDFVQAHPDCRIELKGFVHNEEAKALIKKAQALLLPAAWYEGFPMTIVEAYTMGTPVIGSDLGNVGSVIEDGVTGFTFPKADAERLLEILENWSAFAMAPLAPKFSAEGNYAILNDIYQKVRESHEAS